MRREGFRISVKAVNCDISSDKSVFFGISLPVYNICLGVLVSAVMTICYGCTIASNLVSPRDSEGYKKAEFNLADTQGKIAVYVVQPAWLKSPVDIRPALTRAVNISLLEKASITRDRLITYAGIFKAERGLSLSDSSKPSRIAAAVGAQYLLVIDIGDFGLSTFSEENLFSGSLQVAAALFDRSANKLWPSARHSRRITVAIESEKGTVESSVDMLSAAAAHCITRYFYNCNNRRFNIPEEKKYGQYSW